MRNINKLALLASVLLFIHPLMAQGQGGGHTLFGDLKVDETKVDGIVPLSFDVVLYTEGGTLLGRQTVVNNSRYRYLNLQDGHYDVVVEVEGSEVARVRVFVKSAYKTDFRQDIHLEWKEGVPQRQRARAQTISAADFYDRVGRNKSLFERAQRLLDKRQYAEAIPLLNEIIVIDPADFQAWTELGTAHLGSGDVAEAENDYRRAVQERPAFALALLNLGRLLITQRRYTESIDALTRATGARPDSADSHYLLGETYLKLKLGSKAVPELNEALRLDPNGKADAHLLLAALYDGAGMKDRAASEYEQFLAKRQNYSDRKKLERYISEHKKTSRVARPEE
jgi:tetratricopeptide (TPR) repeat protein